MNNETTALYAFKKYGNTVLRAAFAFSGSYAEAEDIVQEAFRYVLEKDSLPTDPNIAKALLITITKHMAVDVLRKKKHLADEETTESQLGYIMPENSSGLSLIVDGLPDMYKEVLHESKNDLSYLYHFLILVHQF